MDWRKKKSEYSDTKWASLRLRSPTIRLFVKQSKFYWPFVRGIHQWHLTAIKQKNWQTPDNSLVSLL